MTEIDAMMDLLDPQNVDKLIKYMREHRANVEKGAKVTKDKGPKKTVTLASLGLVKKPVAEAIPTSFKRRTW